MSASTTPIATRDPEVFLRMATALSRLGAWWVDLHPDRRVYWSDEVFRIFDAPPDYAPTMDAVLAQFDPEHAAQLIRAFETCATEGTPYDLHLSAVTMTGRRIWTRSIAEAVRDAEGHIVRVQGAFQDITAQHTAEASLAASQQRFRELADSMPFMVWTADADGTVDFVNTWLSQYAGLGTDERPGVGWLRSLHPDDHDRCVQVWQRSVDTGTPYEIRYRVRRTADGTYRWHQVSAVCARDAGGRVTGWYGTGMDIDDVMRLEQDARQQAHQLAATLESLTDGFVTIDGEGRITYWNAEAERLSGRPRTELLGKRFWEEFAHTDLTKTREACERALRDGATAIWEQYYSPPGIWIEARVYPSADGLAIHFRDITEQRAALDARRVSDERLALVAKSTNDALWDFDLLTDALWWGDGMTSLFGYGLDELQPSIDSWTERVHPDEREAVVSSLYAAIDRGDDTWLAEYRFRRKDGSYTYVLDRGGIIRDRDGRAIRMVGGMTDISERKGLEARLRRTQRLESIGTLAGGIAHDLNNLFTPILVGSQLLVESTVEPDRREVLSSIVQSAQRGASLVRQVLSFARGIEGERVEVAIHELVDEIEVIIARSFPKDIEFRPRVPVDLVSAVGDPTQLHQVLLNLCVNARDAMPEGGVLSISAERVTVGERDAMLSRTRTTGAYVLVKVSDTGTGIPAEHVEHIFDPFFTTKEQGKGTGLGLSTVLGIVRSHGGFIDVESHVGAGSTFKVYLPAAEHGTPRAAAQPERLPRGSGELVLLVDDESAVLAIARRTLEEFGYRVMTAGNGAEALARYLDHRDDVAMVLTDMVMPVMDGRTLIAALRHQSPGLRIVAASGLGVTGDDGARPDVRFLPKPYTAESLLAAVHTTLHPDPRD